MPSGCLDNVMNIELNINVRDINDIMDAVKVLQPFIPANLDVIGVKENVDVCEMAIEGKSEFILDTLEDSLNSEIERLRNELKEETQLGQGLLKKIKELEEENKRIRVEIEAAPVLNIPEIGEMHEGVTEETKDTEVVVKLSKEVDELKGTILKLEKDIEFHKKRSDDNWANLKIEKEKVRELEKSMDEVGNSADWQKEKALLGDDLEKKTKTIKDMEETRAKLISEVEFHKNRSKENWDELRNLRNVHKNADGTIKDLTKEITEIKEELAIVEQKNKELVVSSTNIIDNNEEVENMKKELFQVKSEYDSKISELILEKDKAVNELSLMKLDDIEKQELNYLKQMKSVICAQESGKNFWKQVDEQLRIIMKKD